MLSLGRLNLHVFEVNHPLCHRFNDTFDAGQLAEDARTKRRLISEFPLKSTKNLVVGNFRISNIVAKKLVIKLERLLGGLLEIIGWGLRLIPPVGII